MFNEFLQLLVQHIVEHVSIIAVLSLQLAQLAALVVLSVKFSRKARQVNARLIAMDKAAHSMLDEARGAIQRAAGLLELH